MKRILFSILILLITISICFAWSQNVCQNEAWSVKYDKINPSGPTSIYVENLTGQPAFKVTVVIYFQDYFGNAITSVRQYHPGPISKFIGPFNVPTPQNAQKITATVFNTWEYGQ
jgi:hypothetical protein